MNALKDKHVLFSLASISIIILVCAVGAFSTDGANGNGITEITGVISDPVPSQNGTVFKTTDLSGNEFRCFFRSQMPATPVLCKLTGSFSADGTMFFADRITISDNWTP
ncbi:MAG: hypothetical protein FWF40_01850 [Methanomassiliicoccaceae archaeon]|jgi:hypothetical protein|nr:hypothetical protein [Methanomassiliicoccaceae archaeon]